MISNTKDWMRRNGSSNCMLLPSASRAAHVALSLGSTFLAFVTSYYKSSDLLLAILLTTPRCATFNVQAFVPVIYYFVRSVSSGYVLLTPWVCTDTAYPNRPGISSREPSSFLGCLKMSRTGLYAGCFRCAYSVWPMAYQELTHIVSRSLRLR